MPLYGAMPNQMLMSPTIYVMCVSGTLQRTLAGIYEVLVVREGVVPE